MGLKNPPFSLFLNSCLKKIKVVWVVKTDFLFGLHPLFRQYIGIKYSYKCINYRINVTGTLL